MRRCKRGERHVEGQGAEQEAVRRCGSTDRVGDISGLVVIDPEEPIAAQIGELIARADNDLFGARAQAEAAVKVWPLPGRHVLLQH